MRAQMRNGSFNDAYNIRASKRFREDDIGPKEIMPHHTNNHYDQKMSRFQGNALGGTPMSNLAAAGIELIALEKMNVTSKQWAQSRRKTWIRKTQNNLFHALERPRTTWAYLYHGFVFILILASLSLSVVVTNKQYAKDRNILDSVYYLEVSLVFVFTLEYILRIWSCSCHGCYKGIWGKMKFIKKPYMVIDIIVIVATTAVITTTKKEESKADYFSVSLLRFLRFLQVLRVLRIDRQQGAFKMVSNVLYDHRQELLTCCYMTFILIIACSFLVYLAEQSDDTITDNEMRDLGDGIYWGFITLSTIGYGDIFPQNTVAKWITVIFSFVGTAFFALPAGILGSGFALQVAANQKQKHNNRRRYFAAVLIQYSWKNYVAHPYNHSSVTWKQHQTRTSSKERYSVYGGNEPQTLNSGGKSFAYLRKKFHSGRQSAYMEPDGFSRSRRSSIGATIPSALELRDRCQSEGNLLLVSPNHVEDNQATIVSLPQSVITDFVGFGGDKSYGLSHSHQDVYVRQLTDVEKNVVRFIRKVKFGIAVRKFREQLQPYDIKDVVEQYSVGQMEMFSFMKKCQARVEAVLGVKDAPVDINNCLHTRLRKVETKMETLDEKLDLVLKLLRKDVSPNLGDEILENNSRPDYNYPYDMSNPYGDGDPDDRIGRMNECFSEKMQRKQGMSTDQMDELAKRLELLKDASEYSSLEGSDISLNVCLTDLDRRGSRFTVKPTLMQDEQPGDDPNNGHHADIKEHSRTSSQRSLNSKSHIPEKRDCPSRSSQRSFNSKADPSRLTADRSSPVHIIKCKHESLNSINNNSNLDEGKMPKCCSVPVLTDKSTHNNRVIESRNHCKNMINCKRYSRNSFPRVADSSCNSTPSLRRLFSPVNDGCSNSDPAFSGKAVNDLLETDQVRSTDLITSNIVPNGSAGILNDKNDVSNVERQSEISC